MKPIPLNSPWRQRRFNALIALLFGAIAIYWARPVSATGYLIALTMIPALLYFHFRFKWWWNRRFGGSKFLTLVYIAVLLAAVAFIGFAIKFLRPLIGSHFA